MDDGLMLFFRTIGVDDNIIHIDRALSAVDEFHEFVVNHGLEGCWGVGQAEEHDGRFEQSVTCLEGGFPFVAFLDAYVVVSPTHVKFGKPFLPGDTVDELGDKRERVAIGDGPCVQLLIVLDRS